GQRQSDRLWIYQYPPVQVHQTPGHKPAQRIAGLDPQPRRPHPAALFSRMVERQIGAQPRRHIGTLRQAVRPAQHDSLVLPALRDQCQPEAGVLPAEDRRTATGMQFQPGEIAVGMMQPDPEQTAKGKYHRVDQTVLIVDRADQHDRQQYQQSHAGPRRHDEDPSMTQTHLAGSSDALVRPALDHPAGLSGHAADQTAATSLRSRWTNEPPPCPAGSSLARRRWPTTAGSTACTSSGMTYARLSSIAHARAAASSPRLARGDSP